MRHSGASFCFCTLTQHGYSTGRRTTEGHFRSLSDVSNFDIVVQILIQIQQTAIQSQRALNLSKQQIAAKERERRILQLTIEEIKSLDEDVNLYRGVGKMYAFKYYSN